MTTIDETTRRPAAQRAPDHAWPSGPRTCAAAASSAPRPDRRRQSSPSRRCAHDKPTLQVQLRLSSRRRRDPRVRLWISTTRAPSTGLLTNRSSAPIPERACSLAPSLTSPRVVTCTFSIELIFPGGCRRPHRRTPRRAGGRTYRCRDGDRPITAGHRGPGGRFSSLPRRRPRSSCGCCDLGVLPRRAGRRS